MENEVKDTWYKDFFQGINCELWENAIPDAYTKQEVEFLVNEFNLDKGKSILDIPCGYGRHAIELSNRGFTVTGVDISETFIAGLKKKIKSDGLNIKVIQTDILSLNLTESFSAALCLGNSFGYFSFDNMKIFVKKVVDSLETGAKFIINSGMIAESILPNFLNYSKNKSYTVGSITMEVNNDYRVEDSFMISNLHYTKGGKTEEHAYKHYVFTLGEVKRILKSYRLNTIATYNSPEKTDYKLGDQQIYIVARKE